MNVLALDSSTEACSVALLSDAGISSQYEIIGRGHAEHLLPMIDSLLLESGLTIRDMDLFAYGAGPGSFTGIRIGAAMMQGLALAREKKLVAVSSLSALASMHRGTVLSVIDARMGQVYYSLFQSTVGDLHEQLGEAGVLSPEQIQLPAAGDITVVGTGWDSYRDVFMAMATPDRVIRGIDSEYPHAESIARLALQEYSAGKATDPADALPQYVRNDVARKMGEI